MSRAITEQDETIGEFHHDETESKGTGIKREEEEEEEEEEKRCH